jgi:hypothetical protein
MIANGAVSQISTFGLSCCGGTEEREMQETFLQQSFVGDTRSKMIYKSASGGIKDK